MKISKTVQYVGGFIVVALFFLFQYGGDLFQGSGEKGEIVAFDDITTLRKDSSNDGKRIALKGHASVANSDITIRVGKPLDLIFYNPDESLSLLLPFSFGEDKKTLVIFQVPLHQKT